MTIKEFEETMLYKYFYIIECHNFISEPKLINIVGFGINSGSCGGLNMFYYLYMDNNEEKIVYENEIYKTREEAQKEADKRNEKNKHFIKSWTKDKHLLDILRGE